MFKKICALLLAVVTSVSFVACDTSGSANAGGNEGTGNAGNGKKPVTITYWYSNGVGEQKYTDEVEAELNKILARTEGYEHIKIDLHPCKDYQTDFALGQVEGAQIDLVSTPGLSTNTEIVNGSFLSLDDILEENPEITAELPEWFMELGKMNGETWFVPNYQQCANRYYIHTPKEFFEQSGYTYEEAQEIMLSHDPKRIGEFYENYIMAIREYTGSERMYTRYDMVSNHKLYVHESNNILSLSASCVLYWDEDTQRIECTDFREDVQEGYRINAKWYQNGIMYKDCFTDTNFCTGSMYISHEQSYVFNGITSYGTADMVAEMRSGTDGFENVAFEVFDDSFLANTNAAGGTAISATTEHPEEAAMVMALLFNSKYKEFYNTLCWGLEGTHWEWEDKEADKIKTLEFYVTEGNSSCTYHFPKWRGGNTFNASMNQAMTQEQKDYILNVTNNIENEDNIISPLMGLNLSTKPVETELAQVKAVVSEYQDALRNGAVGANFETYLADYLDRLEKAGIQKVLDELNRQVDEFFENQ